MQKVLKAVIKINNSMMWIVGILLTVMAVLLFYAVIMRYFFQKPPVWSYDLTGWFTGLAAFLAGGYALLHDAHVRVDIFYEKFSKRMKSLANILTAFLILLIVIVLVWKGTQQVIMNYQMNTVSTTGLNIYVWIKWSMVPIGGLLLGIQAIVNLINDLYVIATGKSILEEEAE